MKSLSRRRNIDNDGAETKFSGSALHIRGADDVEGPTTDSRLSKRRHHRLSMTVIER